MPERGGEGVVEAEAAQRAHSQGDQGGRIPDKGPAEGQEQEQQVVGSVIVQVALYPRHELVLLWDAGELSKELADGPRGLAPIHLEGL